jgi:hypothetical protein
MEPTVGAGADTSPRYAQRKGNHNSLSRFSSFAILESGTNARRLPETGTCAAARRHGATFWQPAPCQR